MKKTSLVGAAVALALLNGCSCSKSPDTEPMKKSKEIPMKKIHKTPSGLQFEVVREADSNAKRPVKGQWVTVHYTGWFDDHGKLGQKFDSSVDRGIPFSFQLGMRRVIKGWDEGVADMRVGEKRRFTIPADLAYGAQGYPGAIPPNATLIFDVELLGVE